MNSSDRNTINSVTATLDWFIKAGQHDVNPKPDTRQTAFYVGMQLEELGEKLEVIFGDAGMGSSAWLLQDLGVQFKSGKHDLYVASAMKGNPCELLDADMDLVWVSLGAAQSQGADVALAYHLVTETNYTKFPGGVITRHPDTGKVLKPEGWQEADLTPAVHQSLR